MEPAEQSGGGSGRVPAPSAAKVVDDTATEIAGIAEITEAVKATGHRAGGLVTGVAPVDAFNEFVPGGHRPQHLLSGASSVVVAERDCYPIDEWRRAIEFKDEACRGHMKKGVPFAIGQYRKK